MFSRSQSHMCMLSSAYLAALVSVTLLAAFLSAPQVARASDLVIKYDQSQILRLPTAASEIIIGNPSIADVTVQSSKMLVVTGKSFGITNIIALDSKKNIIQDQRIVVQRDQSKVINVQLGAVRRSYNCSSQCNPTITVGDDTKLLQVVAASSKLKIGLSEAQTNGGRGGGE